MILQRGLALHAKIERIKKSCWANCCISRVLQLDEGLHQPLGNFGNFFGKIAFLTQLDRISYVFGTIWKNYIAKNWTPFDRIKLHRPFGPRLNFLVKPVTRLKACKFELNLLNDFARQLD